MSTEISSPHVQLIEPPISPAASLAVYGGAGTFAFPKEIGTALTDPLPDEKIDILPSGEVYLPQIEYRRLLNKLFGPGGWALLPMGPSTVRETVAMREYALIILGRFVGNAIGEQAYIPNNPRFSYATAFEAAKSNALVRCCKDLGIASQCWERAYAEAFKVKYCHQVQNPRTRQLEWKRKTPGALLSDGPDIVEAAAIPPSHAPVGGSEAEVLNQVFGDGIEPRVDRPETKPLMTATPSGGFKTELQAAEQDQQDTRAALWKQVRELNGGDFAKADTHLTLLTTFTYQGKAVPGVTSINQLEGKRLYFTAKKVAQLHAQWTVERGKEQATQ